MRIVKSSDALAKYLLLYEKAISEMPSLCPLNVACNVPVSASHNLIVLSAEHVAIVVLSGLISTVETNFEWVSGILYRSLYFVLFSIVLAVVWRRSLSGPTMHIPLW